MRQHAGIRALIGGITAVGILAITAACGGAGSSTTPTPAPASPAASTTPTAASTKAAPPTAAMPPPTVAPVPSETLVAIPTPTHETAALEPTPPPVPAPTSAPPPPPPPAGQSVTIVAKDTKFNAAALTLPSGAEISLTLDNQDTGTAHDIVIYTLGGTALAQTDIAIGPVRATVSFVLGASGSYAFKCSVHPQQMNGRITAQ